MYGWVEANFQQFLQLLDKLSALDKDLLLSYFVLHRTQAHLGELFGYSQTETSSFLRLACKRLAFFQLFGEVSAEKIAPVLEQAGLEFPYSVDRTVRLSAVVEAYSQCHSYQQVADRFAIRKPDVRRSMSQASTTLLDADSPVEQSIGSLLYGFTHRLGRRTGTVLERRDPDVLGQFCVNVRDPHIDSLFVPRADI